VGKSVIHTSVDQIKHAGPLTEAMAGSKAGVAGAATGFDLGVVNSVWGIVSPDTKDKAYDKVGRNLDKVYDKTKKVGKNIKKSFSKSWNSIKKV